MAVLDIVKWPAPVLDNPADPVTEFDSDLEKLVSNMFETMYAAPGVGLAAVQVGVPKRLFVMDCSGGGDPEARVALVNPVVLSVEGDQTGDEGCLSFPGIYVPVKRGMRARVRALDLDGKPFEMSGEALFARAIQHENDHLIGRLLIDQCGPVKREIIKRKLRKEAQAAAETEAADA